MEKKLFWFKQKLVDFWPQILIGLIWLLIAVTNILPQNDWLLGYDNLAPELNLPLAWQRSLHGVWQNYRGLGVTNSVMDGADLTRLPIVALIKVLLGTRQVRWAWCLIMLLTGTLAAFSLTKFLLNLIFIKAKKNLSLIIKVAGLTTALFYLFNPATVQFFYAPLETFASFYGFLPLILWVFGRYLRDNSWANLGWLILVATLASSAFYVQTFFVVLMMVTVVFGLGLTKVKLWRIYTKRVVFGLITIIIANSFWLLPLIITTLGQGNDVLISKQNRVSTPQVQEMNYTYGNLAQVITLQSYWSANLEYNVTDGDYTPYLGQWQNYWQKPLVRLSGYLLFAASLISYLWTLAKPQNNRQLLLGLLILMAMSVAMLSAGNGLIIGLPFRLASHLPLFQQLFRVAFTKWSTVASLFYGLGLSLLIVNFYLWKRQLYWSLTIAGLAISLTVVTGALIFNGQLFGWQVKVPLPKTYQELATWMNKQPHDQTIVYLPMPNFWGWLFYDWGYRGSGFFWQMIPQATLDRNFDVWSLINQTAYQQLNLAIERNDSELFAQVIKKYNLGLAIVDDSIINAHVENQFIKARANNDIQALMQQLKIPLVWQKDMLSVYDLSRWQSTEPVAIQTHYQTVLNHNFYVSRDLIYQQLGNYINVPIGEKAEFYYPFAGSYQEQLTNVSCNATRCQLQEEATNTTATLHFDQIILPTLTPDTKYLASGRASFINSQEIEIEFSPTIYLQVGSVTYEVPKLNNLILAGVKAQTPKVILDFGDQKPYLIANDQVTDFTVELVAGQPFEIKLIDATNIDNKQTQLEIENQWVETYPFPKSVWDRLLKPQVIPFAGREKITASWSVVGRDVDFKARTKAENCDLQQRGWVSKNLQSSAITYQAANFANLCESYSLTELSALNDYLIWFKGQNLAGNPLQFFVTDTNTQRLIIDQVLNDSQTEQYFYLPRLKIAGNQQNNLYLHFNNKSFGQTSINRLDQVRLLQFPIDYLSQIRLVDTQILNKTKTQTYPLLTNWSTKNGDRYQLKISDTNEAQSKLVVLQKALDRGWLAKAKIIAENDQKLIWPKWKRLAQVTYNGWANAWLIPANWQVSAVELVFWPQYLVWIGFALLSGESILIIYQLWFKDRLRKQNPKISLENNHHSPTRLIFSSKNLPKTKTQKTE